MMNALAEQAALQSLPQHVRRENVWHLLQKISCVLFSFYADPQFAQPRYPAPHRRARHADLPSDTRTTHHDRGIFREQRQQRGDSPVGYARKSWLWLMLGHVKRSSVIPIGSNRECADLGICRRALM